MLTATVPAGIRPEVCRDFLKVGREKHEWWTLRDWVDETKGFINVQVRCAAWQVGFSRFSPLQTSRHHDRWPSRAPRWTKLTTNRLPSISQPQGSCFRDNCRYAHSGHETIGVAAQVRVPYRRRPRDI